MKAQQRTLHNLRVGNEPGGVQVVSPHSEPHRGYRGVPQTGNVGPANRWVLRNLRSGNYYWSVQSIDGGWAGSEFATEGTFTITSQLPVIGVIPNQSIERGGVLPPVTFLVDDPDSPAEGLVLRALSYNSSLIPEEEVVFGGVGRERTAAISLDSERIGMATITVSVIDPTGAEASRSFLVSVGLGNFRLSARFMAGDIIVQIVEEGEKQIYFRARRLEQ